MNRELFTSDENPNHLERLEEFNFERIRIILSLPIILTFLVFFLKPGNLESPVFRSYSAILTELILNFILVCLFLATLFRTPGNKWIFNRVVIFIWILSLLAGSLETFGYLVFFEFIVSIMLFNLFIILDPLAAILLNAVLYTAVLMNFYRGTLSTILYLPWPAGIGHTGLILGSSFFMVSLTALSIIRYRDQTNLLKEQDLIRHQNRKLEEAAKLRDHIDRIVRHDMKNPLTGIAGLAKLLRIGGIDEQETRLYIDMIEQNSYRCIRLLDNSLDLYRMEQQTYEPRKADFDLPFLIQDITLSFREIMDGKRIDFRYVGPSEGVCISGERDKIAHMLSNLFQNALEASPEGHTVTLGLTSSDGCVSISLHNDGVVPVEIRENLFAKYVTAGKKHGTGLGTYSARMIARCHGGDITFTSGTEDGTTFTVTMPDSVTPYQVSLPGM